MTIQSNAILSHTAVTLTSTIVVAMTFRAVDRAVGRRSQVGGRRGGQRLLWLVGDGLAASGQVFLDAVVQSVRLLFNIH